MLLQHIKSISGLLSIGNTVNFDELDEDMYTQFLTRLTTINDKAIELGLEIQGELITPQNIQH